MELQKKYDMTEIAHFNENFDYFVFVCIYLYLYR